MFKVNNNLGMAWVRDQQKPFLYDQKITRGKQKGKLVGYLTRGRNTKGDIIKGKKIRLALSDIIEMPEILKKELG